MELLSPSDKAHRSGLDDRGQGEGVWSAFRIRISCLCRAGKEHGGHGPTTKNLHCQQRQPGGLGHRKPLQSQRML